MKNPTSLQVGAVGNLAGTAFRVAGRVTLGVEDQGQTYYWQEFNLQADDGSCATLVFEPGEGRGEWRLFRLFEPEFPITAADAATKREGDLVNLEGTDARVTLCESSRVDDIEGEAPEGTEVGDIAQYFNAEAGGLMVVVSWTGDEVECYRGEDLAEETVRGAFNLPATSGFAALSGLAQAEKSALPNWIGIGVGLIVLVTLIVNFRSCGRRATAAAPPLVKAPAGSLRISAELPIQGSTWVVESHCLERISEVNSQFEQNAWILRSREGKQGLLIHGFRPRSTAWFFFQALEPLTPMSPTQAAAQRMGDLVNIDGYVAPVRSIFECRAFTGPDPRIFSRQFGFLAQSGSTLLLARWNEAGASYYRGSVIEEKDLAPALTP